MFVHTQKDDDGDDGRGRDDDDVSDGDDDDDEDVDDVDDDGDDSEHDDDVGDDDDYCYGDDSRWSGQAAAKPGWRAWIRGREAAISAVTPRAPAPARWGRVAATRCTVHEP